MITSILIELHEDCQYSLTVVKESEDTSNQRKFEEGPFKSLHAAIDAAKGIATLSPVVPGLYDTHKP